VNNHNLSEKKKSFKWTGIWIMTKKRRRNLRMNQESSDEENNEKNKDSPVKVSLFKKPSP